MKFARLLLVGIFSALTTSVYADERESPLEEIIRVIEQNWYYPLTEEEKKEIYNCVLIRAANTMLLPASANTLLPNCFGKDKYLRVRIPTSHDGTAPGKETLFDATLRIEAMPSGLDGVTFGSITMTKDVPGYKEMDEYFLPHLERMRNAGVEVYSVNLNDNRGGYVYGAAAFLSYFASVSDKTDQLLFEIRKRINPTNRFMATKPGIAANACLAVLVNKNTASAAEIIAYVLQKQMRAYVVGEITFKKGISQIEKTLRNGVKVKFTDGKIFYADGATIHQRGVIPDFITGDENVQRESAITHLRRCHAQKQAERNRLPEVVVSAHE